MEISSYQLKELVRLVLNGDLSNYPAVASAVYALGLPEEVAMMVATEYASKEEW